MIETLPSHEPSGTEEAFEAITRVQRVRDGINTLPVRLMPIYCTARRFLFDHVYDSAKTKIES